MSYSKPYIAATEASLKLVLGQQVAGNKSSSGCLDSTQHGGATSNGAYEVDE